MGPVASAKRRTKNLAQSDYHHFRVSIFLVGDDNSGRRSLRQRFVEDSFPVNYDCLSMDETQVKTLDLGFFYVKVEVGIHFYHRYRTIGGNAYRGRHVVFVCYDITNMTSFEDAQSFLRETARYAHESVLVFLVGTRCDLEEDRVIPYEMGEEHAKKWAWDGVEIQFFETSAKRSTNVAQLFENGVLQAINRMVSEDADLLSTSLLPVIRYLWEQDSPFLQKFLLLRFGKERQILPTKLKHKWWSLPAEIRHEVLKFVLLLEVKAAPPVPQNTGRNRAGVIK